MEQSYIDHSLRQAGGSPAADARIESVKFLQVEPTTRCNFTCGFCYGRQMDQSDLDFDRFREALDLFTGVREIELHGQGEPLSHPRFMDMARLCQQRGISVSTITNGSFFSPRRIDEIIDTGINSILISIESPDAGEFQAIRGGKLSRVTRGISALLKARDNRGSSRPVVGFAVTVLKQTQNMLSDIARLYKELNMDGGIAVHVLIPMPTHIRAYDDDMAEQLLSKTEQAMVWAKYAKIVQSPDYSRSNVIHACDTIYGYGRLAGAAGDKPQRNWIATYRSCPWLAAGLYVNRHGELTACSRILDSGRYPLGNLSDGDIGQALALREEMDNQVRGGHIPAACEGCFIAESIASRLSKLMAKKPRKIKAWERDSWSADGESGRLLGDIPCDTEAIRTLLPLCDGITATGRIIVLLAELWKMDLNEARIRALPIVNELIREGVLAA